GHPTSGRGLLFRRARLGFRGLVGFHGLVGFGSFLSLGAGLGFRRFGLRSFGFRGLGLRSLMSLASPLLLRGLAFDAFAGGLDRRASALTQRQPDELHSL